MHERFVDLLCCPKTSELLSLRVFERRSNGLVVSGELVAQSGITYPIIRGIPRFVEQEQYASSFGYEWNRWPRVQFEAENRGRPMAGYTTTMWERITGITHESLCDQTIVEFGCGPGRFLDVVRRKGGIAVGLELSAAVEAARANFADDSDVLIVQGDVLNPPFRENAFDGGYSIGVLHHTPDPVRGLGMLVRVVRKEGWVSCCVYPKGEFYDYRSVARTRNMHNRLKSLVGYRFATAYAHLSAYLLSPALAKVKAIPGMKKFVEYLERNWIVSLPLADVNWRLLDIFDAITPEIATTHTGGELRSWMVAAGCRDIRSMDWGSTAFVGIKA